MNGHVWNAIYVQALLLMLQFVGLVVLVLLQRIVKSLGVSVQQVIQRAELNIVQSIDHQVIDWFTDNKKQP